jgi:hypothetical protein
VQGPRQAGGICAADEALLPADGRCHVVVPWLLRVGVAGMQQR